MYLCLFSIALSSVILLTFSSILGSVPNKDFLQLPQTLPKLSSTLITRKDICLYDSMIILSNIYKPPVE